METQTANLTALMEKLLSRFDEERDLADKRAEAQTAFNTQVSHELQSLSKQIGLTQAEVDDVRKAASASASSTPSTAPLARLTNEGPPLLSKPDDQIGLPERGFQSAPAPREEYSVRRPKHHFPRFDGAAPRVWLDHCLAYFELYHVPQHNWVATSALYVEGHAALWLRAFRQTHPVITWDLFRRAVEEEFGPEEFESLMHDLLQLRQTGTVAEYRQQFEVHMYNMIALDATLSSKFFVTQFLLGLKDELRAAVRIQAPTSITRATVFARIHEEELDIQRPRLRLTPDT
ncbi:uncharacterized protein LOC119358489 [Triticum dicoccoides]|uniref:uncharacterized protein LOC119358489 n=1 Tax=Triticum dicoccoides TaxID=85692 RepID=UPI00188E4B6E|nr:uncharacterized protein LOC119358489 [Triticum dicoccoides]